MTIEKGDFIKVSYTGKFDEDNIFDTTDEELAKESEIYNPRGVYGGDVIVVGAGHTIQGLDEDFIGKKVGYSGTVDIPPEKGFGTHDPKLVESLPINRFEKKDIQPGMNVEVNGKRGVVVKVIGRRARVDFNHPLAGKTVTYDYTIESKLEEDAAKIIGLLTLYTGIPEIEVSIEDKTALIEVPLGLTFNQRWLMAKGQIATQIIENIGMEKVQYVETYPPESAAPVAESEETEVSEE
ncbi:peptidylprolyl isomerase [Methanohalophilus levihalophilus]|uniref:peptidylprolyl isomerase n=1 Tax=Methanohalophilus levihalophilus TaxID=1431282 RepID=UPI001AE60C47|nr:peptidylprolyl isomerase [Methanohalophilus levihalophilus]